MKFDMTPLFFWLGVGIVAYSLGGLLALGITLAVLSAIVISIK